MRNRQELLSPAPEMLQAHRSESHRFRNAYIVSFREVFRQGSPLIRRPGIWVDDVLVAVGQPVDWIQPY